jgi:hypothetical protein
MTDSLEPCTMGWGLVARATNQVIDGYDFSPTPDVLEVGRAEVELGSDGLCKEACIHPPKDLV